MNKALITVAVALTMLAPTMCSAQAVNDAIGAAKEAFIDDHFDRGDFAADCAGVLMYQVRF